MVTTTRTHPLDGEEARLDADARRASVEALPRQVAPRVHRRGRREVLAWGFTFAGMLTIGFGWYGISGEANTWRQLPYLLSGGVGGASLVAVGVALLVSSEHAHDREALEVLLDRLDTIEHELVEQAGSTTLRPRQRSGKPETPEARPHERGRGGPRASQAGPPAGGREAGRAPATARATGRKG